MDNYDMYYQRRALVPKSEAYEMDSFNWFDVGRGPSYCFTVDDDEFMRFNETGVIEEWNDRFGTMLGEYEEGVYEDRLDTMLKEVINSIGEGTISNAISTAIDEGTGVCFIF